MHTYLVGKLEGKIPLGIPGCGRITLKWILTNRDGGMNWIDLAQISDRWHSLVNAV